VPSPQALPSASGEYAHVAVVSLQVSVVHAFESSQREPAPTHAPAPSQVSTAVQKRPSSQLVPPGAPAWKQVPALARHVSVVHAFPSAQSTQVPPAMPQADAVPAAWQRDPSQHPLQHRADQHVPGAPLASLHADPSGPAHRAEATSKRSSTSATVVPQT
jgi:hypothetical protein